MNTHKSSTALVGSISQVAHSKGQSEADAMLNATTVVAVDTSGSMSSDDAGEGRNRERYEVACGELAKLQAARPGQIVVMSWSSQAMWDFDGVPTNQGATTNIMAALDEFNSNGLDGLLTLTIIADGDVEQSHKAKAVAIVTKMQSRVDCIFIGDPKSDDGKRGAAFLKRLAKASRYGGRYAETIEPGSLAAPVMALLPPPNVETQTHDVINL